MWRQCDIRILSQQIGGHRWHNINLNIHFIEVDFIVIEINSNINEFL